MYVALLLAVLFFHPAAALQTSSGRRSFSAALHEPRASTPLGVADAAAFPATPAGLQPAAANSSHVRTVAHSPLEPEAVSLAGASGSRLRQPLATPSVAAHSWYDQGQPVAIGNAVPLPMQAASPKPRLFFLFLVYDRINNEDVWNRFFTSAVPGFDYRAFVHCKTEGGCMMNLHRHARYEIIPSVETTYCFDLVSAMNALLAAALEKGGGSHPGDKFILVSDSTLPVKPFSVIQQQLTQDSGSDLCIFPRNEWAEVSDAATSLKHVAVKHHQWAVLGREHARLAVQRSGELKDLMQRFQLNTPGSKNTGCLDEFWHFAVLFGSTQLGDSPSVLGLPALNGERVSTVNYEIQGQCDTFVNWVARASGSNNNMTRLSQELIADPGTDMDPASDKRPSSIHRVSKKSLTSLRNSYFLFARKFDDGCAFSGCDSLADAFDRLIFSTPPRPLEQDSPAWVGQGSWMDTRKVPVTIVATDGAVQVIGSRADMNAKGSYCNNHVSVVFTTGFRVEATLSSDGGQLRWSNGAVWWRQAGSAAR